MAQLVKNPPAMQETRVQSLGWEDSLDSPEARRGSQGASRAAPGKSGLHARGEGERVLVHTQKHFSDIVVKH